MGLLVSEIDKPSKILIKTSNVAKYIKLDVQNIEALRTNDPSVENTMGLSIMYMHMIASHLRVDPSQAEVFILLTSKVGVEFMMGLLGYEVNKRSKNLIKTSNAAKYIE